MVSFELRKIELKQWSRAAKGGPRSIASLYDPVIISDLPCLPVTSRMFCWKYQSFSIEIIEVLSLYPHHSYQIATWMVVV